jgi:hypothetical protein
LSGWGIRPETSGSQQTRRWRKPDSNSRSHRLARPSLTLLALTLPKRFKLLEGGAFASICHHTAMPQTLKASRPTEVLAGLVDRATFYNSDNGFCVLRVKARGQRDLITVVGHAAMISAGEFVQACRCSRGRFTAIYAILRSFIRCRTRALYFI